MNSTSSTNRLLSNCPSSIRNLNNSYIYTIGLTINKIGHFAHHEMYWNFAYGSHLGQIINSRPQNFGRLINRELE